MTWVSKIDGVRCLRHLFQNAIVHFHQVRRSGVQKRPHMRSLLAGIKLIPVVDGTLDGFITSTRSFANLIDRITLIMEP